MCRGGEKNWRQVLFVGREDRLKKESQAVLAIP